MIAVTVRRILTLLTLAVPAAGRTCRNADRAIARGIGHEAAPDAVVFRHYL